MKRFIVCLAIFLLAALIGCQIKPEQLRPALSEDGELYVYMEHFHPDSARLKFDLDMIYAVNENGGMVPLTLRMEQFTAAGSRRQRLAALGVLPPGRYAGLAFKVKDASLEGSGEGGAALLAPEKPASIDFPFTVEAKGATVISMDLTYKKAVKAGFSFFPGFELKIPIKPVNTLVGYVVNYGSNDITVFDKAAMRVTGVIPTGEGPVCMVLDQNLNKGFVSLSREDAIQVIDMISGAIIGRIRLNPGDSPRELALTPDGKTLLCANNGSNTVSVIDPVSYIETSRITVGTQPVSIVMDKTGRAWVFNYFSNTISMIDTLSGTVVATLPSDLTPLRGAFNRNGDRFYIINEGSPYLTSINPATLATVKKQFAGIGMRAIKVDTNTDLIYIGKEGDPYIEIYNPFTLMPQDYLKAGRGARYMTIDNDENNLCIVDSDESSLLFINLASRKAVSRIDVGEDPVWVALAGER